MRFIGLDLAWSVRNTSAVSVLETSGAAGAALTHYQEKLQSDKEIIEYIASAASGSKGVCVAIDAPLIVKNKTGARPVDREITSRFVRYGAGAHPCNRAKFPQGVRGERLVKELCKSKYGFEHQPFIHRSTRRIPAKTVFEVYPHPAQIVLFGLGKRILYKKGSVETRRSGQKTLQKKIKTHLLAPQGKQQATTKPPGKQTRLPKPIPHIIRNALLKDLLSRDINSLKGSALKSHEDALDALICAYIGFYHWYWGDEKSEVVGDMKSGYIVLPRKIS
jgi:predicted RNase H-like nuclease